MMKRLVNKALKRTRHAIVGTSPGVSFRSDDYLRHNARRLEHLASLGIDVSGKRVLEVGAGIGDHSHYYIDRGCSLTITEGRPENVDHLRQRYGLPIQQLDLDQPDSVAGAPYEVVHCYGLLYHLSRPAEAIAFLGRQCSGVMFLETCVSFGDERAVNLVSEEAANPTQAVSGTGCRPTRPWVFSELQKHFPHVYIPRTQPNHAEFPLDWTAPEKHTAVLSRAVFVASKSAIANPVLSPELLPRQVRHA